VVDMKKTILLSILFLFWGFSFTFAASPVIYFSDMIDGPRSGWNGSVTKGAAVTIWGKNFGFSRGTNYVTIAGQQLANNSDYAEWGVITNNARGMERITFWVNSNCSVGSQTISVTVEGVTSNAVPFYVRTIGNIRFVDHTNGADGNNGQTDTSAWKTLSHATNSVSAGDIVYIRAGTYIEEDLYDSLLYIRGSNAGTDNNMTAFIGYPAESPVLDTRVHSLDNAIRNNSQYDGDARYMVFSKMKIFPYGIAFMIENSTGGNFRVVGLEIDGNNVQLPSVSTWSGIIDFHDTRDGWVLGCNLHHWGRDKFDHAIYLGNNIAGTNVLNYELAWNEIHDLGAEVSGVYVHPQDTDAGNTYAAKIKIHDNLVYNLSYGGILMYSRAKNIQIYSNIIYNCGSAFGRSAVQLTPDSYYPTNLKFYCNTIYSASNVAVIYLGYSGLNIDMKNNIFYSLSDTFYVFLDSNPIVASDYDLFYGNSTPPVWATHALNSDPLFFNVGNNDFHLQESSPAKDTGTNNVNIIVTSDFDGVFRPQGVEYDIGAYEYAVDVIAPADVNDLAVGSVNASTIALTWTAPGNDGSLGQAASYDIRYSLSNIVTVADWNTATQTTGESSPSVAGNLEVFSISGLSASTKYFFALKTSDYAGNISSISNIASATTSIIVANSDSGGGGGGGGGGCFIATAAYGTALVDEVLSLSRFRDRYLLTTAAGSTLVDLYWKLSPPVARFIEKKEWAKRLVREVLRPSVYFARFMLKKDDRRRMK